MRKLIRDAMTANPRTIGMLAQADIVHEVKDKRAGQLVDEISQPESSLSHLRA